MDSIQHNGCTFIFTSAPEAKLSALNEVESLIGSVSHSTLPSYRIRWLTDGVGLIMSELPWHTVSGLFKSTPPVFVRHICSVLWEQPLRDSGSDLETIVGYSSMLSQCLNKTKTFSVQTRILDGIQQRGFSRFDLNSKLADALIATGFQLDIKKPQQVVSIVISAKTAYIGVSFADENLSDWAGGERRLARSENRISRAEFKLEEALEVFDISLPDDGLGLDLGAAPGGWTRVLRRHGLRVVAVDPAKLDPRLAEDPSVDHRQETTQTFLPTDMKFDIIVNDMRMDARDSSKLMCDAAGNLLASGVGIITLKLPEHGQIAIIKKAAEILGRSYTIVRIKQLFHNRSEVTVYLKKSPELR